MQRITNEKMRIKKEYLQGGVWEHSGHHFHRDNICNLRFPFWLNEHLQWDVQGQEQTLGQGALEY